MEVLPEELQDRELLPFSILFRWGRLPQWEAVRWEVWLAELRLLATLAFLFLGAISQLRVVMIPEDWWETTEAVFIHPTSRVQ